MSGTGDRIIKVPDGEVLGITHRAAERGKVGVSELVNTLREEVVTYGGFYDGISYGNTVGKLEGS